MTELIEITDAGDPRLTDYRDLRDVQLRSHFEVEQGLFLGEGEKVIRRAIEAGYRPRSFLMAPKWVDGLADVMEGSGAPCYVISEAAAIAVTGFHVHRGALASFYRDKPVGLPELLDAAQARANARVARGGSARRRIVILESLVDHANVGSVFRNAAAMSIDAVLISPRCADPLYRRAIKTSMGNVFNVPWTRFEGMEDTLGALVAAGYTTAALTLTDDAVSLDELVDRDEPALAFVFGTEGDGVDRRTAAQVGVRVKIPMDPGVDSLNVAAAAAVTFYATR